MKLLKIVLIVVAALAVLVGLVLGVVFYATSGATQAADEFFAAGREGDYVAAYNLTSAELRNDTNPSGVEEYLKANGLDRVTDTSWSSRSIQNNVANLEGSVTTEQGGTTPLKMRLVKEGESWRIALIELMRSGLSSGPPNEIAKLPSPSAVANLVRINTGLLAEAARRNDPDFWAGWWAGEIPESELRSLIDPLREHPDLISALEQERPQLESMRIDDDGLLEANAAYQFSDADFAVSYRFARVGEQWKVAELEYKVR